MDVSIERDSSSALGTLFQQIINDMKNVSPLWEDFIAKATKLHACLRAAIQAIAAYLDAFQKIADAATNSRGASKEIGTALTRVCLRHKAVETRLKTFTTAIMDCLVQPLQEKLEEWKRSVVSIDKEHAKEYKRYRTELKKRSTDTLRLQKKARKGQSDTLQSLMDSHMQDVTLRRAELEEVEKKSLRSVMIEERTRYCNFVYMLQPVVKEECEVISELGHLQEAMQSIALVTKEPHILPAVSEELIHDVKASINLYPESPGCGGGQCNITGPLNTQPVCSNSLGSRKSSICSISSMNSSGSSNSPGHSHHPRSISKLLAPNIRLKPGESSDSGFCSSPALTAQAAHANNNNNNSNNNNNNNNNGSHINSTWPPHSQEAVELNSTVDRPHTISSTYEKGHQRPPLTVYTFQNPETIIESSNSLSVAANVTTNINVFPVTYNKSPGTATTSRPPLPVRCSSLERPLVTNSRTNYPHLLQRQCPSPIPAHVTKELSTQHHLQQTYQHQQFHHQYQTQQQQQQTQHMQQSALDTLSLPTYANISELNQLTVNKYNTLNKTQSQQAVLVDQQQVSTLQQQQSLDSISSLHSNESVGGVEGFGNTPYTALTGLQQSPGGGSTQYTPSQSSNASLHSHPSIESNVTTSTQGQTPNSGSSTPQNHYSPLLTNSPSSTAADTPSGSSITSGCAILQTTTGCIFSSSNTGTIYNVCTLTPPPLLPSDKYADIDTLKISEVFGQHRQEQMIDNDNSTGSTTEGPDSSSNIVETDERSRASVLQKASMFEKQAAAVKNTLSPILSTQAIRSSVGNVSSGTLTTADSSCIYGTAVRSNHSQDLHLQTGVNQQELDKCFEDSIQELNNLIGELDSFQREIDTSKYQQHQQQWQRSQNAHRQGQLIQPSQFRQPQSSPVEVTHTYVNISNSIVTSIKDDQQENEQHQLRRKQTSFSLDHCPVLNSNQTNSSACGTDLADTRDTENCCLIETSSIASVNYCNSSNSSSTNINTTSYYNNCKSTMPHQKNLTSINRHSDFELNSCCTNNKRLLQQQQENGDGYENPTFALFTASSSTSSICEPYDKNNQSTIETTTPMQCRREKRINCNIGNTSDSYNNGVVIIYDHQPPVTPDIDYVKQNSEIVMLRPKSFRHPTTYSIEKLRELEELPDNLFSTFIANCSPNIEENSEYTNVPHAPTVAPVKQRLSSFRASHEQLHFLQHNLNISAKGRGGTNRISRRSSVNTTKPPPPIRRSSSVTPSPNTQTAPTHINTNNNTNSNTNMLHSNQTYSLNTSFEHLPPPPAYLLDVHHNNSSTHVGVGVSALPNSSQKVTEVVKAFSSINLQHNPGSPHNLKRLHTTEQQYQPQAYPQPPTTSMTQVTQSFRTSSLGGIYALPKALNNMSSFRAPSAGPNTHQYQHQHYSQHLSHLNPLETSPISLHSTPSHQSKPNLNLVAQLNARINKQQQQKQESMYGTATGCSGHQQQRLQKSPDEMRMHTAKEILQQQQQTYDDYSNSTTHSDKTGSIRNKAKADFLENLNTKLAKQGLSGRAFAVRNFINSKALPDPRICHESLMDQIKRGAILKRNQKINDRSAPNIY